MKRVSFLLFTLILALSAGPGSAATFELVEWTFNDGGTVYFYGDVLPTHIDMSGFDEATGLGQIVVTFPRGMAGDHNIVAFFDHDIDFPVNGYINETGAVVGTPAPGQAWEIDEPGYVNGDIFNNVENNTLDNAIGATVLGPTTLFPEDVSMAMSWNFTLAPTERATVVFNLGEAVPMAPFYLEQNDPDSVQPASVYFDSSLAITAQVSIVPNIILPLLLSN